MPAFDRPLHKESRLRWLHRFILPLAVFLILVNAHPKIRLRKLGDLSATCVNRGSKGGYFGFEFHDALAIRSELILGGVEILC